MTTRPAPPPLLAEALLPLVARHAADADRTRSLHPSVIAALKASQLASMAATRALGGSELSIVDAGREFEALAPVCGSTAWTLWNNATVFHLYAAQLGPEHQATLTDIVAAHATVSFPGGAGSRVRGIPDESDPGAYRLNGPASFASAARYADWLSVLVDATPDGAPPPDAGRGADRDLRFAVLRIDDPALAIDPTWDGASLRASATDDVRISDAIVPADRIVPWRLRFALRDPQRAAIHPRYREDWVGLAAIWLAAMATGITDAALQDAAANIRGRIAAGGRRMADLPVAHANLGQAWGRLQVARAAWHTAAATTDARIQAAGIPREDDYLHQTGVGTQALTLCREAMDLVLRVLGGNGLRESASFERRYRDFQALPLHIIAHQDRISEQIGRHLLGLESRSVL